MKRILIILVSFLLIFVVACEKVIDSPEGIEFIESTTDSISETDIDEIKPAKELNLTEIEEWSGKNRIRKAVLLGEKGYYYNVVTGGELSPESVFCFDNGDGKLKPLLMYGDIIRNNVLYGSEDWTLYKYENGRKISLKVKADCVYYTEEYIYFNYFFPEDAKYGSTIYRMNYNGKNITPVIKIAEKDSVGDFVVYNNKIWYRYYHEKNGTFACYDLETEEILEFDHGGIGLINNGYMYYKERNYEEKRNRLYRFNLETYEVELVCDANVQDFDFCGDYIVYMVAEDHTYNADALYRMNLNENKKILSASQLGHSRTINRFNCDGNRIFVEGDIYYYSYIAEIDIDGNEVKKIHENEFYEWDTEFE